MSTCRARWIVKSLLFLLVLPLDDAGGRVRGRTGDSRALVTEFDLLLDSRESRLSFSSSESWYDVGVASLMAVPGRTGYKGPTEQSGSEA